MRTPSLALSGLLVLAAMANPALADENPAYLQDPRQPISVSVVERNHVLFDMRSMLHGMFNIQNALGRGDLAAVAVEAKPMGKLVTHLPPGMLERAPEGFRLLGSGLETSFDKVIDLASKPDAKAAEINHQLAEALSYCSGCHDSYRFQVRK